MGQKMTSSKYRPPSGEEITKHRFDFQYIIGKGGFGKVWRVIDKKTNISYALKEMHKVKVIDKRSEKSIKYERELLTRLKNPFIVNMYYSFQDYDNLYLVMDLLTGGDLRYHVSRHRRFTEEQTKFFIACITLGLEYIHSNNVIHRDIKPENLVLDDKGYVRITDFGIAKLFSAKNANETSGTPGYMSPEVMKGIDHTSAVDFFALGVIGYEFMLGRRPYLGKSRKEIKEQMMAKAAYIKLMDIPDGWSEEAADFINRLLQRKPEARLGYKCINDVKSHSWLKYFPWDKLKDKRLDSPFIPEKKDNYDKKYCESIDVIGIETKGRYEQYRNYANFNSIFHNFTYYGIIEKKAIKVSTPLRRSIKKAVTPSPSSPNMNRNYLSNYSRPTSVTPKRTQNNHNGNMNSNKGNNRSYTNIALLMKSESRNKGLLSPSINKSVNLRSVSVNRRSFNTNQSRSKQKMLSKESTPTREHYNHQYGHKYKHQHLQPFSASITSPINNSKNYSNKKQTKTIEGGYLNQKLMGYQTKATSLIKYIRNNSCSNISTNMNNNNKSSNVNNVTSNYNTKLDNKALHRTKSNYGSLLNKVPFYSKSKMSFNISGDELTSSSNGFGRSNNNQQHQPEIIINSPHIISKVPSKKNITTNHNDRKSASHNSSIIPLTSTININIINNNNKNSNSNSNAGKHLTQSHSMNYFFKNNKITSISSHSTSSSASNNHNSNHNHNRRYGKSKEAY